MNFLSNKKPENDLDDIIRKNMLMQVILACDSSGNNVLTLKKEFQLP
jgi:hypothetical protein